MSERKRTNAEIDHLNQFVKEGEAKLPYEVEDKKDVVGELTEEQKIEAQKKEDAEKEAAKGQKKNDEELDAEKNKIIAADKEKSTQQNTIVAEELDDEKVLAYLKNKKGKEVASLEDLINPKKELTPEEKEKLVEVREANKYSYGLSNGLFSKKELENYIADSKNPTETVFSAYAAKQKELDPALTDKEIKEEFDSEFGLDEDDKESRRYKKGQVLLNNLAYNIINQKYPNILNLENNYSDYEKTTSEQKEAENKIATKTPLYIKDLEAVKNEMSKVSFQIGKDDIFEIDLPSASVENVISKMMAQEQIQKQVSRGWSKEELKQVAQTTAIIENLPFLLKSYGDAQVLKNQKGVRGVPPTDDRRQRVLQEAELTDRQKEALNFYRGKLVNN